MNQAGSHASATATSGSFAFQLSSFQSFQSTAGTKYGGLLKKSLFRSISNDLISLLSYSFSEVPTFEGLHIFISGLRLLQLFGPTMLAQYTDVWNNNPTMSVISVLYQFIPPQDKEAAAPTFMICYIVMSLMFILLLFSASKLYKSQAFLPKTVTFIISYYLSTIAHVVTPVALSLASGDVARLLFNTGRSSNVVIVILTIACTVPVIWISTGLANQTLIFRFTSLSSITIMPQTFVTFATNLACVLFNFGANASYPFKIASLVLSSVLFLTISLLPYYKGGFVHLWQTNVLVSSSIVGSISCIVGVLYLSSSTYATSTLMFSLMIAHVFGFLLAHQFVRRTMVKHIMILDRTLENPDNFHLIKSSNHFINVAVSGFRIGHPECIDWSFFRMGVEAYPKSPDVWFTFGKFVAIYPEEMQTLAWIFQTVVNTKLKGTTARCLKQQALTIARMRETNLSPDLKSKLNSLHRQIQQTKHKLSRVWDVAIQGNVREIEQSSKSYIEMKDKNNASFEHLLRQFTNNRFITRAYAHFLTEICADQEEAEQMRQKTLLLQRGSSVAADQIHELGCKAFPMIPDRVSNKVNTIISSEEDEAVEDEVIEVYDSSMDFKSVIENLKIPAVRNSIMWRVIMNVVLILGLFAFLLLFISSYLQTLTEPLYYMRDFAECRTINTQIAAFSNRYMMQELGVFAPTQKTGDTELMVFNGSWATRDHLYYSLVTLTSILQKIETFAIFRENDPNVLKARDLMFSPSINMYSFNSQTDYSQANMSIVQSMSDYIVQLSAVSDEGIPITPEFVTTSPFLNPLANSWTINAALNNAMDFMTAFIVTVDEETRLIDTYVLATIIGGEFIVYTLVTAWQLIALKRSKEEAYRCLTVLPKSAVSSLSENLRVFKKNASSTSQEEYSKKDEAVIKIFNTGVTASTGFADMIVIVIGTIVNYATIVIMAILLYNALEDVSLQVKNSAPQINAVHGSYFTALHMVYVMNNIAMLDHPFYHPVWELFDLDFQFTRSMERGNEYWNAITIDFTYIRELVSQRFSCDDRFAVPDNPREAIKCFYIDLIFESISLSMYEMYELNTFDRSLVKPDNDIFGRCFDLLTFPLYGTFFLPMFEDILNIIEENMQNTLNEVFPIVGILMAVSVLVESLVIWQISAIGDHIRSVLLLLLHYNSSVITSIPKVMDVLSGNFKASKVDFSSRSKSFFDAVYESLPDAVMYTNTDLRVVSCNSACSRILQLNEEDLINHHLKEVLERFEGKRESLLSFAPQSSETLSFMKEDGTLVFLQFTSVVHNQRLIVSVRDVTSITRYNTLIQEERAKSDRLLNTIIPKDLVGRVQSGEKNISFAVQSVSIAFLDIVEFTPWCGSLPAQRVMQTLNKYFSKLDELVSKYPTLSRMKCIGDCYMVAGGIFSEHASPAEHAKEMVSFGLDAIDAISQLNSEIGENLRIRVGVNTGGPVVTGVLGIGKPTFEIFGPAINMAQQMEHHGVPMHVHVSRPVYELIYGENFKIKERGNVEVKGGKVLGYLVSR